MRAMIPAHPDSQIRSAAWVKPLVAAPILLCLLFYGTPGSAGSAEFESESDFQMKAKGLTDRARSYALRAKALKDLSVQYPEQVSSILIGILKDPIDSEPLRYLAAQTLAEIRPLEAAAEFEQIFRNRREDVFARRIAFGQLMVLRQDKMRGAIVRIIEDMTEDPSIRQYALGLYGNWDLPGKVERLRRFVRSKSESLSMRQNALFILESLKDEPFVHDMLREILTTQEDPEEMRKNSVIIVERAGYEDLIPLLVRIACSRLETSSLRQIALSSLGRMGDPSVLPSLERAVADETHPPVKNDLENAIRAIRQRMDEPALQGERT